MSDNSETFLNEKNDEVVTSKSNEEILENAEQTQPKTEEASAVEEAPKKDAKTKKIKKKHGVFFKIGVSLLVIVLVLFLPIIGFLAYSAIDSINPIEYIPEGHYAYVNIDSAGELLQKTLSVQTLDSVLSSPDTARLQGAVRSFRALPMLSSWWFGIASNVTLDIAAYPGDNFLIFGKLGFRSAGTRLLPLILRFNSELLSDLKELKNVDENGINFWQYDLGGGQSIYFLNYKDSVIASTSKSLFFSALSKKNEDEHIKTLRKFIKEKRGGTLSVLSDVNYFTKDTPKDDSISNNVVRSLKFPEAAKIDLTLDYKDISFSGLCKWETESEGLNTILQRQAFIPGILNRLPKSADYISLINMGDPQFIFQNGKDILGSSILQAYASANKASKLIFSKSIDDLFFSWIGEELGVFEVKQSDVPIFFVSLKDEKRCRDAFELIYSSFFVNRNISALVDGIRIPRIEFPGILTALLRAFKVELPTPFYVIEGGYLYLSQSSEALASMLNDVKRGNLLVKTENWKNITRAISPETSVFVYYNLENQIPSFLRTNEVLQSVLKGFGRGLISIRFEKEKTVKFEVYAQKTEAHSLGELSAFPYDANSKLSSYLYCGKGANNEPFAYWTSGANLYALNLADKQLKSIKLDDKAYLNLETKKGIVNSVWAVSARGTVYKTDYNLTVSSGFPILTGEKLNAPPSVIEDKMVVPVANKPVLLYVESSASFYFSEEMNTRLRSSPSVFGTFITAVPRSFDSFMYVFDDKGKIVSGYPKELDGISAAQPILYKNNTYEAVLTEQGLFSLKPSSILSGKEGESYSIDLNTSCKAQPVYSDNLKMFFLVTDNGFLYKLDTECNVIDKIPLKQKNASDYLITLIDLDSDGYDEVLVSGGGNSIYAYNANFSPVNGFPVAGTGIPHLIDVDGNGRPELITCGIDNRIHSYTGVSK
ncbi:MULTISPECIES: VCBS repeat-containing protein [unclassified Treponema]|uniref:FG-GAP repeat domain-containing protein n=1 Tax=unclassified Treponema TaxID=2638727 RepID=UPI0020A28737|nr:MULTISPECIES: VCBS repeat-containing protein [unclassified Treponema]UTC68295.1 VCBS repeat-containing protein [Treponema sp. OMZ 789]UTC71016.1 VCBS repeat-containing protein [Treponema sp. OMZ 790]UTC73757.1 VCBS repeat-containing protein [Treponema sp. OMZ 791]